MGKSAEIVRLDRAPLPRRDDLQRDCARLIWTTFPASSRHGVCRRAEREAGVEYDAVNRILGDKTKRIDLAVMLPILARFFQDGGDAATIAGLTIRIKGATTA